MSYQLVNGRYQVPIVDFGKQLQSRGWNIGEHSAFGGNSGGHAANSYHNYDEAIDITWKNNKYGDFDPSGKIGWQDWTDQLGGRLTGAGAEVLHRSNDPNHSTHVHLAAKNGMVSLSPEQYADFGFSPDGTLTGADSTIPQHAKAKGKAQAYKGMTATEINEYHHQKMRAGRDTNVAEASKLAENVDVRNRDINARTGFDPRFDKRK